MTHLWVFCVYITVVITSGFMQRHENNKNDNENDERNAEDVFGCVSGGDLRRNRSEQLCHFSFWPR